MGEYLLNTPHGYYLRVAVPKDLRDTLKRREIKKSLLTRDRSRAIKAAQSFVLEIEDMFASLRGVPMGRRRATLPGMSEIIVRELGADGKPFREHDMTVEEHRQLFPLGVPQATPTSSVAPNYVPQKIATEATPIAKSPVSSRLKRNDVLSLLALETFIPGCLRSHVYEYLVEKEGQGMTANRLSSLHSTLTHVTEFFGDVPMRSVTRAQVAEYISVLSSLPVVHSANRTSAYRGMTIREIAIATQKRIKRIEDLQAKGKPCTDSVELLDPVSVNRYICDTEAFWEWCGLEERSLPNPFGKQKIRAAKKGKKKRDPFTPEHLSIIFHHPIFVEHKVPLGQLLQPHHFFVPLIAAYTGMRIEEICQLHCADVKKLHGIWMFDINRLDNKKLKNDSSERCVPLHADLIHFGLLAYLAELMEEGELLLFPNLLSRPNERTGDMSYSNSVTVWFGRLLTSLNLKSKTLVFHSFRHTFRNSYKQQLDSNDKVVTELLGHAHGNLTDDTYGSAYFHKTLKDVIDTLKLDIDLKDFVTPWKSEDFYLSAVLRRIRRERKDPYLDVPIKEIRTAAKRYADKREKTKTKTTV